MKPEAIDDIRRTSTAMRKLCNDEPLTEQEWEDLSQLSLIDRNYLEFCPSNCRWATSDAERADNLTFYKSLGVSRLGGFIIH